MTGQTANFLEKHFWSWRGYKIQYTVKGTGTPMLLIHGFGASLGHWRNNISALAEAGYQVFAIDLLGFGGSDQPALSYTMELWQQQIKDFWEAKIQQPTVVVGNSIGGLLSLMVMTSFPEMTAGGVLINAAGGLNHRPEDLSFPLNLVMGGFTQLVSAPVIGKILFNRIRQKSRIRRTLGQVYYNQEAVTDELVDLIYTPASNPGAQKVFASVLTAPAGPKPEDLLPQLEHPLLVLWGENDPWTPITGTKIYQQLSETSEDVEFDVIPQAGHCCHDEKPDIVNERMINWLAQLHSDKMPKQGNSPHAEPNSTSVLSHSN